MIGFIWLMASLLRQKPLMEAAYINYKSDLSPQAYFTHDEVNRITDEVYLQCDRCISRPYLPAFLMLGAWIAEIRWLAKRNRELTRAVNPNAFGTSGTSAAGPPRLPETGSDRSLGR